MGEIGPIDLSVLVLPQYGQKPKITSASSAILSIIELAAEYLISEDMNLVGTTGQVLESLLSITICSEAIPRDKRISYILAPFRCDEPTAQVTITRCCPIVLESKLNQLDLKEYTSYARWVTELTCGIINSILPEGSFLQRLLPLCQLKVIH